MYTSIQNQIQALESEIVKAAERAEEALEWTSVASQIWEDYPGEAWDYVRHLFREVARLEEEASALEAQLY